jgi:hypothetical protein
MTPQLRAFYRLESRWKNAEVYDVASYLSEVSIKQDASSVPVESDSGLEQESVDEQMDPFWK